MGGKEISGLYIVAKTEPFIILLVNFLDCNGFPIPMLLFNFLFGVVNPSVEPCIGSNEGSVKFLIGIKERGCFLKIEGIINLVGVIETATGRVVGVKVSTVAKSDTAENHVLEDNEIVFNILGGCGGHAVGFVCSFSSGINAFLKSGGVNDVVFPVTHHINSCTGGFTDCKHSLAFSLIISITENNRLTYERNERAPFDIIFKGFGCLLSSADPNLFTTFGYGCARKDSRNSVKL